MSSGLFWSALATFALLMVYLEYRFRPRCETHGEHVYRIAECVAKKRSAEKDTRKEAVREVLADDDIVAQFCERLERFSTLASGIARNPEKP
jgi:hypothetical protein